MPRIAPRPDRAIPEALHEHARRLDRLDRRRPPVPAGTLPTSPAVGQVAYLTHTTGTWHLIWNGTAWIYLGGADLWAYTGAETGVVNSASYPASPLGPSVTVPRTGTYDVYLEARHRHGHTAVAFTAMCAFVGAAAQTEERAPVLAAGAQVIQGSWVANGAGTAAGVALAAGASLGIGFRSPNAVSTFYAWRQIRLRPRSLT